MSIETHLREALSAEAVRVESSEPHPYERVAGAVTRNRRTRRLRGVAAVAVVAALAVGVPAATGRWGDEPSSTLPAGRTRLPAANDPAWRSFATWPTRGNLAGDADLVRRVGDQLAGRPLLVEDVGDRRVAVVADGSVLAFAEGPRGAQPSELERSGSADTSGDTERFLSVATDRTVLVLAAPSVKSVQVSGTPDIGLDGTVTRSWSTLGLEDGVGRGAWTSLSRLRVGSFAGPETFRAVGGAEPDLGEASCAEPCTGAARVAMVESDVNDSVAALFDLANREVRSETVIVADVPAAVAAASFGESPTGARTTVQVVLSTLPGGQVVRTVRLEMRSAESSSASDLEVALPLPAASAHVAPVVIRVGTEGGSTRAWVIAPEGAALRAVSQEPSVWPSTGAVPLTDGSATLDLRVSEQTFETQYSLELLGAGGRVLGTFPTGLDSVSYEVTP